VSHIPESAVGSGSASGGGGSNSDGSGSDGSGASGGKINVNKASVEELSTLPRVGPVMAQRIVAWRKDHGPFLSVDDLDAIEGIGPKLMESLRPLVTVQGG
jgi:competence protein ComEA